MAGYQERINEFAAADIAVVAASCDSASDTHALAEKLGLTFPVLCGVDADDVAERFGAYTSDRGFVHATGFVVRPDGTLELAVYSSGSRGRITADDALDFVGARQRPSE